MTLAVVLVDSDHLVASDILEAVGLQLLLWILLNNYNKGWHMDLLSVLLIILALEFSEFVGKWCKKLMRVIMQMSSCYRQTPVILLTAPVFYLGAYRISIILVGSSILLGVILEYFGVDAAYYLKWVNQTLMDTLHISTAGFSTFWKVTTFVSMLNLLITPAYMIFLSLREYLNKVLDDLENELEQIRELEENDMRKME